jgi:hypothetical protein
MKLLEEVAAFPSATLSKLTTYMQAAGK